MGVDVPNGMDPKASMDSEAMAGKRPERKVIQCAIPPSHPEFDRSKFSADELVDLLMFENREIQATTRKTQERVHLLENILRQNNIPLPNASLNFSDVEITPLPVAEGEVPQRSARRRLETLSSDNKPNKTESAPANRHSVTSITSNGPIDIVAGMPISQDFKSELMAAAALESKGACNQLQQGSPIQTRPIDVEGSGSDTNSHTNLGNDIGHMLNKEPIFTNIASEYVSPYLLQDEYCTSTSSGELPDRRPSASSAYSQNEGPKSSSDNLPTSQQFKLRIRLPTSRHPSGQGKQESASAERPQEFALHEKHLEMLNPYINTEKAEVSTIGTRGSLLSSMTRYDTSRDSKNFPKIVPQTPQMPKTPDGLGPNVGSPVFSQIDNTTLNSSSLYDQYLPLSPVQRTPKAKTHRDFFKIPNALSFGSSDSVTNRNSTVTKASSFLVLPPSEEEDVPLIIKPEDFHTIRIKVVSTISVNAKRSDDPNCTFSINDKESGKEMWRIRKSFSQIVAFDNEIRPVVEFFGLPILPDKSLFSSFTPSKVDNRLRLLQDYFDTIFRMPHIPQIVLFRICRYISLDFVNPLDDFKSGAKKEGFLIRRYKGLGTSWKVRWCQIDGPALEIYELPGGLLLEQIKLGGSQIGRQSSDIVAEERGYRHAFLIIEGTRNSKMSSSLPKHFFCAETNEDRDGWISAMVEFAENDPLQNADLSQNSKCSIDDPNKTLSLYDPVLDDSIPFEDLKEGTSSDLRDLKEEKRLKKRSMFNFRSRAFSNELPKPDLSSEKQSVQAVWNQQENMQTYLDQMSLHDEPAVRIFGLDLLKAYELSHYEFKGLSIPSICFRCFDFLDKRGAIYEEGIFRLSGSALAIRQLKQKFNVSLDVDLFETQLAPDVHTVAGLLKAYLRELPSSIFGTETYVELQLLMTENSGVIPNSKIALMIRDYLRRSKNVNPINYDFCVVIFGFLRSVISESAMNRMSLKNVCIVFVPTLNISIEILSLCLVDYDCIFGEAGPTPDHQREVLDIQIPTF